MWYIKTFVPGTVYFERLKRAAERLTERNARGFRYTVETIWFDFGRGWSWTTVICNRPDGASYQAFYPADQEAFLTAGEAELDNLIDRYFEQHGI